MSTPLITIFVRHAAGCKYADDEFSRTGSAYQYGSLDQVFFPVPDYAAAYAAVNGGNASASGTYVPSLGSIFRARLAEIAKSYVGNSSRWAESNNGGNTTCNLFVRDCLIEASADTQLNIPAPVRSNLSWYQSSYRHPFLAADWANPSVDGGCWKPLPAGSNGALPGDVIATGYRANGNDGTGHVGIVVEPNSGAPNYKDASAGDVPLIGGHISTKAEFYTWNYHTD